MKVLLYTIIGGWSDVLLVTRPAGAVAALGSRGAGGDEQQAGHPQERHSACVHTPHCSMGALCGVQFSLSQ